MLPFIREQFVATATPIAASLDQRDRNRRQMNHALRHRAHQDAAGNTAPVRGLGRLQANGRLPSQRITRQRCYLTRVTGIGAKCTTC